MKKYILFFVLVFAVVTTKAQSGFNYYQEGFWAGASYGKAEADLKKQDYHPAFSFGYVYNFTPYLPITAEFQFGKFSGGSPLKSQDLSGRYFTNQFKSFNIHADLQAGEIIDYADSWFLDRIKNIYLGTGIGVIYNKVNPIERYNRFPENGPVFPDPQSAEGFQGKSSSLNLIIPIRLGYEFKIYDDYDQPKYSIDIGVQHYFDFGEGIDGYNDPPAKFKNNAVDQYTYVTLGVKLNLELFFPVVSYTKLIRKFQY